MGMRDEMFRTKVLIFMIPLVLPIGQPPAEAVDDRTAVAAERVEADADRFPGGLVPESE